MGNRRENPTFRGIKNVCGGTGVFDTETGKGDPSAFKSFKASCRKVAKTVLSDDPENQAAIELLKWSRQKKVTEPDVYVFMRTFKAAGLETSSFYY